MRLGMLDGKPSPQSHRDTENLWKPFPVSLCLSVPSVVKGLQLLLARRRPHNPPVAITPWQHRIRRAEQLAAKHPFAAEILGFYIHVARFQEGLHQRLERSAAEHGSELNNSAGVPPAVLPALEQWASRPLSGQQDAGATKTLLASFPQFLSLVEEHGPARLAEIAHDLRSSNPNSWTDLFTDCWTRIDSPTDPQEFLVLAFLQPAAEFARAQAHLQLEGYTHPLCPFCNRKPASGVLRQQGDGGRRSLLCGFCLTEWDFRRVVCPGCGQEDNAKLPVYTAEELPYIRVECCDACQTYIKSIDFTKNGLADPLVDELASIPLNLWAQERGYAKLHPNLLGM
jgi:FdhE protein